MIVDKLQSRTKRQARCEPTVNMGFLAGGETALAAYARNVKASFPTDWRGNNTAQLPILQRIDDMSDVDLYVFFTMTALKHGSGRSPSTGYRLSQGSSR